jgi:hypothetical protein
MTNETNTNTTEPTPPSRRVVVTTAAQVAVTAPAVTLLLNALTKSAFAAITSYQASQNHILDDFTFGNNEEDIDALETGSNFNPANGNFNPTNGNFNPTNEQGNQDDQI